MHRPKNWVDCGDPPGSFFRLLIKLPGIRGVSVHLKPRETPGGSKHYRRVEKVPHLVGGLKKRGIYFNLEYSYQPLKG